jgi:hypothetical protein
MAAVGLGTAVLAVVAAVRAVKAAGGPRRAGPAHVLLIMGGVAVGAGAADLVSLLIWRWRRWQAAGAVGQLHGAAVPPLHGEARAAQPLPHSLGPRSGRTRIIAGPASSALRLAWELPPDLVRVLGPPTRGTPTPYLSPGVI